MLKKLKRFKLPYIGPVPIHANTTPPVDLMQIYKDEGLLENNAPSSSTN